MRTLLKFALLFLAASAVRAQSTYYIATNGSDSNSCTTSSRCATVTHVFGLMHAGDTLIIGDGTYDQCLDHGVSLVSGSAGPPAVWTTYMAEHDWAVTFHPTGSGSPGCTATYTLRTSYTSYIVFQGIKFNAPLGFNAAISIGGDHFKFIRIGSMSATACAGNTSVGMAPGPPEVHDVLIEDSHFWGCDRYPFDVYQSFNVVLRRVVTRYDFNDTSFGPYQKSGITVYDADNVVLENCIILDSGQWANGGQGYVTLYGGLWHENHATSFSDWPGPNLERNTTLLGNVFLNIHDYICNPGTYPLDGCGINASWKISGNTTTELETNNVFWDSEAGAVYGIAGDNCNPSCGSPTLNLQHNLYGATTGTHIQRGVSEGVGANQSCNDPDLGSTGSPGCSGSFAAITFQNNLMMNNNSYGNVGFVGDYNGYYGNTSNYYNVSAGAHDKTANPGLLYLPRIEATSPLHNAGSDGTSDIGPSILYEYGCSGCMWGDTGYNTLTSTPLWPYPYESVIKQDFAAYDCPIASCSGNSPPAVRGFVQPDTVSSSAGAASCLPYGSGSAAVPTQTSCPGRLYGGSRTLTSYIWEYLGNACPSSICNYGNSQAATPSFSPGAGTYSGTQTVTLSTISSGAVICWNLSGSPATNGTTGCTTGNLYSGTITVSANQTIYAVAGGTGYTDSTVASAKYVITGSSIAPTMMAGGTVWLQGGTAWLP